jgi:hypothetical protein
MKKLKSRPHILEYTDMRTSAENYIDSTNTSTSKLYTNTDTLNNTTNNNISKIKHKNKNNIIYKSTDNIKMNNIHNIQDLKYNNNDILYINNILENTRNDKNIYNNIQLQNPIIKNLKLRIQGQLQTIRQLELKNNDLCNILNNKNKEINILHRDILNYKKIEKEFKNINLMISSNINNMNYKNNELNNNKNVDIYNELEEINLKLKVYNTIYILHIYTI